ncbi:SGNH hydrolase [Rhizodiscina lignyota]|uniref:SGNH hydrolase n=1 Tax=Rhizodiscina lignyota TaxID=1504668 RepID=A0A9P4IGQ8_9PEZI|nr:SGNH hydrolase [Rhizodiscina lignyota]
MLTNSILTFILLAAAGEGTAIERRGNAAFTSYTALGDSYASGNGPTPLLKGPGDAACHRTQGSYPYQFNLKYRTRSSTFQFLACTATNTTEITEQVFDRHFGHPDLVTLDAGGNDGNFISNSLANCIAAEAVLNATAYEALCNAWIVQASALEQTLKPNISALIKKAQTHNLLRHQKRKVVVTGYAQPFNISGLPSDCPTTIPIPPLGPGNLADRVNLSVLALNAVIEAAAYENGALYADIDAAFDGHRVCDAGEDFFQTDSSAPNAALAHPTADGYLAVAEAVARALGLVGELAS